jgi:GlpG protein
MRLLISLNDQKQGHALSAYLTNEGFDNKLEIIPNADWGSADYGSAACKVWIIDEDHFDEAKRIAQEFVTAPDDPRFLAASKPTPTIAPPLPTYRTARPAAEKKPALREPMGNLTFYLLILCTLILFFSEVSAPVIEKVPPGNLPLTPFLMPQLYKDMMFDYPQAWEILDKIINAYGANSLLNPETLPAEAQPLLQKFYNTPYWKGFYDLFMEAHRDPAATLTINAPLFEKERQGEIWRLFTPCLLHADILHLIFNMLWLAVLGRQMEFRLGKMRYLLFIVTVGVLSNTAQYLMGGPNFLGFSGILTGMLAFVWVRRRHAAWEGYQLQPGTLGFIAFFILLMFAIQLTSFIAEYYFGYLIAPSIANTAHLSGALIGYLLGKIRFFSWKMS